MNMRVVSVEASKDWFFGNDSKARGSVNTENGVFSDWFELSLRVRPKESSFFKFSGVWLNSLGESIVTRQTVLFSLKSNWVGVMPIMESYLLAIRSMLSRGQLLMLKPYLKVCIYWKGELVVWFWLMIDGCWGGGQRSFIFNCTLVDCLEVEGWGCEDGVCLEVEFIYNIVSKVYSNYA